MLRVAWAPAADSDLESLLAWTLEVFGERAMVRYQHLIDTAVRDLAGSPQREGSVSYSELSLEWRTYHLFHIRKRAAKGRKYVRAPRHFIVYRIGSDGTTLDVGRILHDSVDVARHMPRIED